MKIFLIISILIFFIIKFVNCDRKKLKDFDWHTYKYKYKKQLYYGNFDEERRRRLWNERKEKIYLHNSRANAGLESYFMAENPLMDMDDDEINFKKGFDQNYANRIRRFEKSTNKKSYSILQYLRPRNLTSLPVNFDSRKTTVNGKLVNLVPPVKDQLLCGSCYAFSALDAMSAQYRIKYGKMIDLSIQELTDCSYEWGNGGCNHGGSMENVYRYAWDQSGVLLDSMYPYNGTDNLFCLKNGSTTPRFAATSGLVRVAASDTNIRAALLSQPLSVALNADPVTFLLYSSGVYTDIACSSRNLNHAALLVGYGIDSKSNLPYWLIKNSWGPNWGMGGYMRILRTSANICGIISPFITYPVLI